MEMNAQSTVALDEYFARIGYTGDLKPSLENLQQLHVRHTQFIPFENLDPFLRRPVRLDLPSLLQPDYEVTNWSNHPQSHFVTGLIAARPAPGGRYTLHNTELAVHDLRAGTERCRLASPSALRAVLEDHFQLTLPDEPKMDEKLERLWAA
jgi:arylamine N-acetyltransferase